MNKHWLGWQVIISKIILGRITEFLFYNAPLAIYMNRVPWSSFLNYSSATHNWVHPIKFYLGIYESEFITLSKLASHVEGTWSLSETDLSWVCISLLGSCSYLTTDHKQLWKTLFSMKSWSILGFQATQLVRTGLPPTGLILFILGEIMFTVGGSWSISPK